MHSMTNRPRWQIQSLRQMNTKITLILQGPKIIDTISATNSRGILISSNSNSNNNKSSRHRRSIEIQIHLVSVKVAHNQPFKRLLKWPSTLWQRLRGFSRAIKRQLVSFWAKTRWLKCWNKTSPVRNLRKKWMIMSSESSIQKSLQIPLRVKTMISFHIFIFHFKI